MADVIITLPVRRRTIRFNGAQRPVLELVEGLVRLEEDEPQIGISHITNPLKEWLIHAENLDGDVPNRIFVVLDELPGSNPGLNDDGPSLNHDLFEEIA